MARSQEEMKSLIIENARNFFARYGYSKTTVDEIAMSVRMGKSSLYYYFKNKEEIFKAVLDEEIKILKDEINSALRIVHTPEEKFKAYVMIRMRAIKKMANFYRVFKDEYLKSYAFIQKIRQGYDLYEISVIKSILSFGVEKGTFCVKDIPLASTAIFTAVKGLEYDWAVKIGESEIEKNVDKLLEVLFYGIVKR